MTYLHNNFQHDTQDGDALDTLQLGGSGGVQGRLYDEAQQRDEAQERIESQAHSETRGRGNNTVTLSGMVMGEPTFSHEVYEEKFYDITLCVRRRSGMEDILPVSASEHLLNELVHDGNMVTVTGQFRSYNKMVENKSKLMLTVFARDITALDESVSSNEVTLTGYVCKRPVYRTTPFHREICDLLLAVNRQYGKSDYIPCIVWGRNARFASDYAIGERVCVVGRVQSREYQKRLDDDTVVTRTAYEVSVSGIRPSAAQ